MVIVIGISGALLSCGDKYTNPLLTEKVKEKFEILYNREVAKPLYGDSGKREAALRTGVLLYGDGFKKKYRDFEKEKLIENYLVELHGSVSGSSKAFNFLQQSITFTSTKDKSSTNNDAKDNETECTKTFLQSLFFENSNKPTNSCSLTKKHWEDLLSYFPKDCKGNERCMVLNAVHNLSIAVHTQKSFRNTAVQLVNSHQSSNESKLIDRILPFLFYYAIDNIDRSAVEIPVLLALVNNPKFINLDDKSKKMNLKIQANIIKRIITLLGLGDKKKRYKEYEKAFRLSMGILKIDDTLRPLKGFICKISDVKNKSKPMSLPLVPSLCELAPVGMQKNDEYHKICSCYEMLYETSNNHDRTFYVRKKEME